MLLAPTYQEQEELIDQQTAKGNPATTTKKETRN